MKKLILTFSFLVLLLGTLQASVSIIPMPSGTVDEKLTSCFNHGRDCDETPF